MFAAFESRQGLNSRAKPTLCHSYVLGWLIQPPWHTEWNNPNVLLWFDRKSEGGNIYIYIVTPPSLAFNDHPTQAKVIIIHKNSAQCVPHHIPFIHQPPLAQLVMLLTFQSNLSSSWPQECAELFPIMIMLCWVLKTNVKKQGLNTVMPPCPPFVYHLTQAKVIIIHKISALCAPHHIPFLPRPPLAQQEMPSIFQPRLSSSWPQVCADFFLIW